MEIILYNTKSPNNAINKVLENPLKYEIRFKGKCDIKHPVIVLKSLVDIKSNYCYIAKLERFYFITNITIQPNNIFQLDLEVDVLESFKDDILKSKCLIVKQEDTNNYYNVSYETEVRKECDLVYSDKEIEKENSNILVTIGG